ncbi:MAG: hypothetical protein WBA46_04590 [Thermomicrobiales bacterium]
MAINPAEVLYGFHQITDLFNDNVSAENIPAINTAIEAAVTEHNRQLDTLSARFVGKTTEYKRRYKQYAATRSQPLDQNGRAQPIKARGSYDIALPIQGSGSAWGVNYVTKQMMTVQDANDITRILLDGDTAWMVDHILAALFLGSEWTFPDDEHGDLKVQPLANGDAITYTIKRGQWTPQVDNHLLAQSASIADASNPFPGIYDELTEHPENGTRVVTFIASDLRTSVENLANFKDKADPNIQLGANADRLVGDLGVDVPGTLVGYVDQNWIVEWPSIPSGYLTSTTVDVGEPALAQREYPLANLQGFKLVGQRDDHPFEESQYARWAGFGAWNRVGALVMQIGAGTYSVPTGLASPMP